MKKLKANVCAVTHNGRVREQNEDNYSLNGRITEDALRKGSAYVQSMVEPFHLSVCDGMGGESYGDVASHIAVQTIAAHASRVYESGEDFAFAITGSLEEANNRICAEITSRGKRMGTTLAALYAVKGRLLCVNIGDTRVYHYSKGLLEQMSFDHTHAQSMVDAGQASQDAVGKIPDAKRLTRHLGVFPEEAALSPNISVIDDVDSGDILLLCSDGLTDMVSDSEITAILSASESAQDAASKLVRKALENGGKDNVTVMVAFFDVEETAIFTPIAAAMVGDSDADYEDEYRTSFGAKQGFEEEENPVSPYANADARAYVPPVDKGKIIKIAVAVAAILAVLALIGLVARAVIKNREASAEELSTTGTTYNFIYSTEPTEPTTWVFETSTTSTTESTTSTTATTAPTTRQPRTTPRTTARQNANPTTRARPTTTKAPTTKAPATTTKAAVTTTKADVTTTKADVTTTKVDVTTTAPIETTTAAPDVSTTAAPEPGTTAPIETTTTAQEGGN
ncbi:MAG: serine/threonine-protein phosphatase [Clostridia bacterium]|nr:serine/threonine-protein phosphatase [Clostridia bacterium]